VALRASEECCSSEEGYGKISPKRGREGGREEI
jgi:hypothetical protein